MSSDGQTREVKAAIHVAASQGHEYIDTLRQLLLAKDISINIVNNYGEWQVFIAGFISFFICLSKKLTFRFLDKRKFRHLQIQVADNKIILVQMA